MCRKLSAVMLMSATVANTSCSRQDSQIDDGVAHLQSTGVAAAMDVAPQAITENDARGLAEKWFRTLRESKYAKLEFRSVRTAMQRSVASLDNPPIVISQVKIEANVVMEPQALWLIASDNDPQQQREVGKPAIILSFVDGEVTEKLWYPAFKQYRTIKYPAPSPWGANDTQYQHACQIGLLLSTWLGEADIHQMFRNGFAISKMPPSPCVIDGRRCFEFSFDSDPELDLLVPRDREKRIGSYFFDESGRLLRTTQTARLAKGDVLHEIVQVEDYEFTFADEKPPEEESRQREAIEATKAHP